MTRPPSIIGGTEAPPLPPRYPPPEPERILEQVARQHEDDREHREADQEPHHQHLETPAREVDDRGDEPHREREDREEEPAHLRPDEALQLSHVPRVPADLQ